VNYNEPTLNHYNQQQRTVNYNEPTTNEPTMNHYNEPRTEPEPPQINIRPPQNVNQQVEPLEAAMKDLKTHICQSCGRSFIAVKEKSCGRSCTRFSKENNMDPGIVPTELSDLTYLEQQLIARIHPVVSVYKIRGHQLGYHGHVINFPQNIKDFATKLPHLIPDLTSVLAVRMKNQQSDASFSIVDFHVRAQKVKDALIWLKANNRYYRDIEISNENLALLPEDGNMMSSVRSLSEEHHEANDTEIEDESSIDQVTIFLCL
jgi:hypothetical protein